MEAVGKRVLTIKARERLTAPLPLPSPPSLRGRVSEVNPSPLQKVRGKSGIRKERG